MSDKLPRLLFYFAAGTALITYGIVAERRHLFPYALYTQGLEALHAQRDELDDTPPWYYRQRRHPGEPTVVETDQAYPGVNLATGIAAEQRLQAWVMDMAGRRLHTWELDWFELWPDADHIPQGAPDRPRSQPGTIVHGAVLMANGDLVFNFEYLGLMRLDACGNVVWRLPYRTHHSIHQDDDGKLWVSGRIAHPDQGLEEFPLYQPPFEEETVLKVSPDGEILYELSVLRLLKNSDLEGLLYLRNTNSRLKQSGDTLHLNDVEVYPATWPEGTFKSGDVMISLRNINAVIVFDPATETVRHLSVGRTVRQHDPDFIDGDTLSIFDNRNAAPAAHNPQSRILRLSTRSPEAEVIYQGNPEQPFFTHIMGKHQWLPNGNLLITESVQGRAFEIDANGSIVWEYLNEVDRETGLVGLLQEVSRLPLEMAETLAENQARCAVR